MNGYAPGLRRSGAPETTVGDRTRWWSSPLLRALLGITAAGARTWVVVSAAGSACRTLDAVEALNGWWLAPAIGFEALAYVCPDRLRRLAGPDADLSTRAAIELNVVVNGLGLLTPPHRPRAWPSSTANSAAGDCRADEPR